MPEYNGGYVRRLGYHVEYWYSVRKKIEAYPPDGAIVIEFPHSVMQEASQEAKLIAQSRITAERERECLTENENVDTEKVNPEDDGTHTGDRSDSPEDSGCNSLDFQKCAAKRGFLVAIRNDDIVKEKPEKEPSNTPIGYILHTSGTFPVSRSFTLKTVKEFWCIRCVRPSTLGYGEPNPDFYTPVYRVNIGIYSQVCDCCGKLIIDGVKIARDSKTPLCLFGKTAQGKE